MKITFYPPCHYCEHFNIDKEIIKMEDLITRKMKSRQYGPVLETIDFIPIIAPKEELIDGAWEEDVMFSKLIGRVSVYKRIDYDKYINGTIETRKKLIVKCILESIVMIKARKTTKFDMKKFKKDLFEIIEYSEEEIINI